MDQLSTRITTAFICHPNAKVILREIDVAMARCGFLPASVAADGDLLVQLVAGSGMWHLMRMTPMSSLWTVMDSRGTPFFQLLGKQLAAPGFAVIAEDGQEGEVFFELDAQGSLRASGVWGEGDRLGEIRLSQPIQPFSSGLRSLWNQGSSQAAVDGLDDLSPAQAFLRIAILRLGGESLQSDNWTGVQRMEGRFAKADEAEVAAFLARKEQEREEERLAAAAKQSAAAAAAAEAAAVRAQAAAQEAKAARDAAAAAESAELDAPSLLQPDEETQPDAVSESAGPAETAGDGLDERQSPPEAADAPAAAPPSTVDEPAQAEGPASQLAVQETPSPADVAAPGALTQDLPSAAPAAPVAASAPAEAEQPSVPSYASGQPIEVGDAVAIDDGFSGGRMQAVAMDAAAPGGFVVALDVGGGRLQQFDGSSFVKRAQRLGQETLSYHAADGRVVDWLQARTAEGDARAQLYLGIRLLQGTGIDKDPKKAYEYLVLAADQNQALAQYLVAMMSKNPTRSARYWGAAAEQGHAPSQFCMGVAHVQGAGVPRDLSLARGWFERAAAQLQLPALYNLGVLDHKPEAQILQDPDTKLPRLQQMAEGGDVIAAWALGQLALQEGSGLDVDQTALELMTAAGDGFDPAWRTVVDLLASNRLSDHVRELLELGLSQAPEGPAADLGKGLIFTAEGHTASELATGVRYLHTAAEAGDAKAKTRLQVLQVELLAHAPDLVAQAQLATPELGKPLLPLLRSNAQALQTLGESSVAPLGPNGRMQALALWSAAAQLGDADAAQALQALQADPRWAQVQVLGELVRQPVGQTESLAPVEVEDSPVWSMSKSERETGRQALDTGADAEDAEDAEAKLLSELLAKPEGDAFAQSLSSDDLEVLGAFKDMPSLQTLDTMSAESVLAAPADGDPDDAQAQELAQADTAAADAGAADAQATDAEADAQVPAVFVQEPPPKRRPWWKFWAR